MSVCGRPSSAVYAADPKKEIIGKRAEADGVETIEYKRDGTITETLAGGDVVKAKYSFSDSAHMNVELEGPMSALGAIVSPIKINGGEMDVTGVDGSSVPHYKRATDENK